jgi:hypothetical protein
LIVQSQTSIKVMEYMTMCDASAGLAVDNEHFVVANDEDNILRIFHIDQNFPVSSFDLSAFLGIEYDDKSPEVDLEGAARLGDYYFFISSHGRDKNGRFRGNRCRFFAVQIEKNDNQFIIRPVGKPYRRLMDDLVQVNGLKKAGLYSAYLPKDKKNQQLNPKIRGANIESLAATPDGKQLLIGFRNPRPDNKAIVISLKNPEDVLLKGAAPQFGKPMFLDLGGLGIRGMEYNPQLGQYMIIAGAHDSVKQSALYLWQGGSDVPAVQGMPQEKEWNPETLILYPGSTCIQILSDDGTVLSQNDAGETCLCKDLADEQRRKFRGLWIEWKL